MIVNVNTRRMRIDSLTVEKLKANWGKLSKYLPNLHEDTQLNFFIKKGVSKIHPGSKYKTRHDYMKTKLKLANFEGWVKLILPKKVLYARFQGETVRDGFSKAKRHLLKEIKKYKDLHFKSQSQYPSHETIRGKNG